MRGNLKFYRTEDLSIALEMMSQETLKPIAGGTDFLVALREDPSYLRSFKGILDLTSIKSLTHIKGVEGGVEIGSLVTHTQLAQSPIINKYFPALAKACASIGSTQIRNRGTLGGNVCHAAPSGDTLGPLMVYQAIATLESKGKARRILIPQFLKGPKEIHRFADELLTTVILPFPPPGSYSFFVKIGRRMAQSKARLSLSCRALLVDGLIREIILVPGAVTPYPQPFTRIGEKMKGLSLSEVNGDLLGEEMALEMVAITGERWSTPYKKRVLATLLNRAIQGLKGGER